MPYILYKLFHLLGIFTVITVVAATGMHVMRGGSRENNPYRRTFAIIHGVAVFLILLGGFGMLARLGVMHGALPAWVYLKLLLWLIVGGAIALPYRGRGYARALLIALPLLALLGGVIALYKPFQ